MVEGLLGMYSMFIRLMYKLIPTDTGSSNNSIALIVGAVATWRLAYMLMREEGPYDVFEILRYKLGIRFNANSVPYATTPIGRLFLCYYCLSIWCGFFVAVLQRKNPILYSLFYSACTIFIWEHRDG